MKIPFLISGCALLFIVTGCFQNESEVEVSPTFDNEFGEMFGIDQKLGIVGGLFLLERAKNGCGIFGEKRLRISISVLLRPI